MLALSITGKEALFDYISDAVAPDSDGLDKAALLADTRISNADLKTMIELVSAECEHPAPRLIMPTRHELVDTLNQLLDIRLGTPGTLLRQSGEVEIESSSPHVEEKGNSGVHVGNRFTSFMVAGSGDVADGELHHLREEQGWLSVPLNQLMGDSLAWETIDILRHRYIAKLIATHHDPLAADRLCRQNYIAESNDSAVVELSPQAAKDFGPVHTWLQEHKNGSIALATVFRCLGIDADVASKNATKLVERLREQEIARLMTEQKDLHRDEAVHQVDTSYIRAENIVGIREYRIYSQAIRKVEVTLRDALHLQPIDPAASAAGEPKAAVAPVGIEENVDQWTPFADFAKRHNLGKETHVRSQSLAAVEALSRQETERWMREEKLPEKKAARKTHQNYIAAFGARHYLLSPRAVIDAAEAIQPLIDASKVKWTGISAVMQRWGMYGHHQRGEAVAAALQLRETWIERWIAQHKGETRERAMDTANQRYISIKDQPGGHRIVMIHPDAIKEVDAVMQKIRDGVPSAVLLRKHGIARGNSHAYRDAMSAIDVLREQEIGRLIKDEHLPHEAAIVKASQTYIAVHGDRRVIHSRAVKDVDAALDKMVAPSKPGWISLHAVVERWGLQRRYEEATEVIDQLRDGEIKRLRAAERLTRKDATSKTEETYLSVTTRGERHHYLFSPRAVEDIGRAMQARQADHQAAQAQWTLLATLIGHKIDVRRSPLDRKIMAAVDHLREERIKRYMTERSISKKKASAEIDHTFITIQEDARGHRTYMVHSSAVQEITDVIRAVEENDKGWITLTPMLRRWHISLDGHDQTHKDAVAAVVRVRQAEIDRLVNEQALSSADAVQRVEDTYIACSDIADARCKIKISPRAADSVNAALQAMKTHQVEWTGLKTILTQWAIFPNMKESYAKVLVAVDKTRTREIERLVQEEGLKLDQAATQVNETYIAVNHYKRSKRHTCYLSARAVEDVNTAIQEMFPGREPKADTHVGRLKVRQAGTGANLSL
jgi:hypothetical protein